MCDYTTFLFNTVGLIHLIYKKLLYNYCIFLDFKPYEFVHFKNFIFIHRFRVFRPYKLLVINCTLFSIRF